MSDTTSQVVALYLDPHEVRAIFSLTSMYAMTKLGDLSGTIAHGLYLQSVLQKMGHDGCDALAKKVSDAMQTVGCGESNCIAPHAVEGEWMYAD